MTFKYERIVAYVANTLWAIESGKWAQLLDVLAFRAAGFEFTPEQIAARLGPSTGKADVLSVLDARAAQSSGGTPKPRAVAVVPIRGVIANRMGGMPAARTAGP